MTNGTILIVDGEKESLRALEQVLRSEFEKVITLHTPDRIPEVFRKNEVDVVMLDSNFRSAVHNGNEGLFWMREVFNYDSNISVVIVTAFLTSSGMSYWGKLSFSLSIDVLLEPVLIDCVQDVVVRERGIILKFRKFKRPLVNLLQRDLFDVHILMLPA